MENWINALDWCAASGVIDYDAPAFIMGQSPRYIGHPDMGELPMQNDSLLPKGIKLKSNPCNDVYGNDDNSLVKNPTWKKVLFGTVIAGGIAAAGLAIFGKGKIKLPKISGFKVKMPDFKKFFINILDYVKKPFKFITSKIKSFRK